MRRRDAVDGPMVQMRTPFSSRTSLVASSRSMKYSTPLPLVNTIQSNVEASSQARPQRVGVLGRRNPNRRRRNRLGAPFLEHLDELARLLERPGDDDALAEERPFVEPAQMLAQPGDGADDEQRRLALAGAGADVAERALDRLLRRQRAVVDERRAFLRRAPVREEGVR